LVRGDPIPAGDSTSALPGSGMNANLHDFQPYGFFGTPTKLPDIPGLRQPDPAVSGHSSAVQVWRSPHQNAYRSCSAALAPDEHGKQPDFVIPSVPLFIHRTKRKWTESGLSGNSVLRPRGTAAKP
jgi:hypothetical protein